MNNIMAERYASEEMVKTFSKENRYQTWRRVWLALAEEQARLGFPVSEENLKKVKETPAPINFERVKEIEKETRHDVMAHLKHWAEVCPEVNTTIHIGATSCYVTDNAECVIHKEALGHIIDGIDDLYTLVILKAMETADIPAMGYTHFQPASPTTIGKRIAMWAQDLKNDYDELSTYYYDNMKCRGVKGTTGTQASFLELVDGDIQKVENLDWAVARKLGFTKPVELSGQTISRKQDVKIGDLLTNLAITLSKMGHDVRLLSHTGDLREGFAQGQVGSSAMPYKRNPMMAERLCALTRLVPQYREMLVQTAMTQWLERSLDDSATRRVAIPDMFLAIDSAINTACKLVSSLDPNRTPEYPKEDTAFLTSELLLAHAVKNGHDRQEVHEKLKQYSLEARNSSDPVGRFWGSVMSDNLWKDIGPRIFNFRLKDLTGLATHQTLKFVRHNQSL